MRKEGQGSPRMTLVQQASKPASQTKAGGQGVPGENNVKLITHFTSQIVRKDIIHRGFIGWSGRTHTY